MTSENIMLPCPKKYGIRSSNNRHTFLGFLQMLVFKIALVINSQGAKNLKIRSAQFTRPKRFDCLNSLG